MQESGRSTFEAELRRLGYGAFEPYEQDPCRHRVKQKSVVFAMPKRDIKPAARTFGELGWLKYEGCKDCVHSATHVFLCGGLLVHVRVFIDGELSESFGRSEILAADRRIDEDEDE